MPGKVKDITKQRWGNLEAVEFVGVENKRALWLFRCDCGNNKVMPADNVKWGNVRSCGCRIATHIEKAIKRDLTNMKFDRLTAVSPTDRRDTDGSVIWKCKCDCGNTAYVASSRLVSNKTKSCGCLYRSTRTGYSEKRWDRVDDSIITQLIVSKGVRKNNTSGCTGVYYHKQRNKWGAYINYQKHRISLGLFQDKKDAITARKKAEQKIHDPIISEKMDSLQANSKKAFIAYLTESLNGIEPNVNG